MLSSHRTPLVFAALALLASLLIYASAGVLKPVAQWSPIDILSEGCIALMAGSWFVVVLSSRPAGRVTALLAGGLAGLMLGAFADCLDEFFMVAKGQLWNHVIESGMTLGGMVCLTWGLFYWRQEQLMVSEHLQKRERLFRDHRAFDHLTQLGDADYLRAQLQLEHDRGGSSPCTLVMFDVDSFHQVNRAFGQREGDRLLQAISHVLLLNLRNCDLLCRYAGDRFAVLMPGMDAESARALADHLRRAVAGLRHHTHTSGTAVSVTVRYAARHVDAEPRTLLKELNGALERRMPQPAAGKAGPGPAHTAAPA